MVTPIHSIGWSVKQNDWVRLNQILQQISQLKFGYSTSPTFFNLTLTGNLVITGSLAIPSLTPAGFVKNSAFGVLSTATIQLADIQTPADTRYLQTVTNPLSMPTITAQAGKFLKTDGSVLSWDTPSAGSYLTLDQTSPQTVINGAPLFSAGLKIIGNAKFNLFQGAGGQAADLTYTLPAAYPVAVSQVLQSTTAGVMSWVTPAAGGLADAPSDGSYYGRFNAAWANVQPLAASLTSLVGLTYVSASFVKMTAAGTFGLDTTAYQVAGSYQALSTNLTSLAGLTYVSASFVKMTAAGTFGLDTATYVPTSRTITATAPLLIAGTTSADLTADRTISITGVDATHAGSVPLSSTPVTNTYLRATVTTGAVSWQQMAYADISGTPTLTHTILSATHTDTLADAVIAGDLLIGNATPKWARFAANSTATKKFLNMTSSAPSWDAIAQADCGGLTTASSPTFAGLALGVGSITMSGSLGVTGTRLTKGWFTDLQISNAPIIDTLTATRVTFAGASKQLVDSANLTFVTSTLTIGVATSALGVLKLCGNTSGTVTIQPAAVAGTPTFTLPSAVAGANNYPLIGSTAGILSWNDQAVLTSSNVTFANFIATGIAAIGTTLDTTRALNVAKDYGNLASGNVFGFVFQPHIQPTSNSTATVYGITSYPVEDGSKNLGGLLGFFSQPQNWSTAGTCNQIFGYKAFPFLYGGGTTTAVYGFYAGDSSKSAGSVLTTQYGVYLETMTAGTTNWGIYSAGGNNALGGSLSIGKTTAPAVALDVTGAGAFTTTIKTAANVTYDFGAVVAAAAVLDAAHYVTVTIGGVGYKLALIA